jgi:hypothetical protein
MMPGGFTAFAIYKRPVADNSALEIDISFGNFFFPENSVWSAPEMLRMEREHHACPTS